MGLNNLLGLTVTLADGTVVGSDCTPTPDGGKICEGFLPNNQGSVMLHFGPNGEEVKREPVPAKPPPTPGPGAQTILPTPDNAQAKNLGATRMIPVFRKTVVKGGVPFGTYSIRPSVFARII